MHGFERAKKILTQRRREGHLQDMVDSIPPGRHLQDKRHRGFQPQDRIRQPVCLRLLGNTRRVGPAAGLLHSLPGQAVGQAPGGQQGRGRGSRLRAGIYHCERSKAILKIAASPSAPRNDGIHRNHPQSIIAGTVATKQSCAWPGQNTASLHGSR